MSENTEPKLIIDEDWKTRVQREKEEMNRQKEAKQSSVAEVDSQSSPTTAGAGKSESADQQLPPPSIAMLIYTLGAQSMAALGQLPMEEGETPEVNLDLARHFIDLLGVLEEKTRGNLTPDENKYLQDTLYQLRLAFVEIKSTHS